MLNAQMLNAQLDTFDAFMRNKSSASMTTTFEVVVERRTSRWIPFKYRLSWCKQRDWKTRDWLEQCVEILTELGGLPGTEKMQVGDVWRFRVTAEFRGYRDYWGEWNEYMDVLKSRCFKKNRGLA